MQQYDLIVDIWTATQDGPTPHSPDRWAHFAGMSSISTRPEGPSPKEFIPPEEGYWGMYTEGRPRKFVKVLLPAGVHAGCYELGNCNLRGLYSDNFINDGMGQTVYAWCNVSTRVKGNHKNDIEDAIDASIASGITLSVPQADGGRKKIPVEILAVSDLFTDTAPKNWKHDGIEW